MYVVVDDDNIIIDQFDIVKAQTFEELEPGNTYLIGMIAHDEPLPNYIGLDLLTLPLIFDQCIAASGNSFNIIVAENNTVDCISNTQDSDILSAIEIVENPVSDHLRIEIGQFSGNQLSFQIYNINGQAINKSQIIKDQQTIEMDLNHVPGGIYFLNVRSDKGQASFKFLKI